MSRNVCLLLMVCVYSTVCGSLVSYTRLCNKSSDCSELHCCRDRNGNLVGEGPGNLLLTGSGLSAGICSMTPSSHGQECNSRCGCSYGNVCYRTFTGACCPPMTCWNAKEAAADRKFWDDCMRNPNCQLPPVVNPGPTLK